MKRWQWLAVGAALAVAMQSAQAQEDAAAALAQLEAETPGTLINDPTRLDWDRQGETTIRPAFD